MPEWDDEIDGLYDLEPGGFVATRNALAKRVKIEGDKGRAAEVARLSRPTVVAWALNRAVRDDPDRVTALIDAAAQLTSAQADLMAGGDREALRTSTAARRAAAGELITAAAALTGPPPHTDALRNTLDAALADPELVDRLRAGTLSDTLDAPAGFGFDAAPAAPSRARAKAKATPIGKPDPAADPDEAPEAAEAERREQLRIEARAVVARIEAEVAAAADAVEAATTEVEQTDDDVREAEDALSAAKAEHDRTVVALDEARRQLDALGNEGDSGAASG